MPITYIGAILAGCIPSEYNDFWCVYNILRDEKKNLRFYLTAVRRRTRPHFLQSSFKPIIFTLESTWTCRYVFRGRHFVEFVHYLFMRLYIILREIVLNNKNLKTTLINNNYIEIGC